MSHRKRLGFLLLVGALLTVVGWAYPKYFLARPEGVGPAGPAVPAEPFQQIWTDRKVLLVGIGDSITTLI